MAQGAKAMSTQPATLRLIQVAPYLESNGERSQWIMDAASELHRLMNLAYEQHTAIYGLRLQVLNLQHNNEVLTNALWKACGDDEQVVNDTIESQGTLR
jgi:hypothetical protein